MKHLAIVGTHPLTRGNAPFDNPEYEIWVFNEAPQADWCKRWDAVFQLHKPEVYRSRFNHVNKTHWEWLQQSHGKTIWMQDVDPMVPDSKKYPLDEIIQRFPMAKKPWFDLSSAYALALAMFLGYQDIEVYGMDLISNTEYTYQLRCWNYWVGYALGAGINLKLMCSENDFGNGKLYAYDGEIQLDKKYFKERVAALEKAWEEADTRLRLAKISIEMILNASNYAAVPEKTVEAQQLAIAAGEISGALNEAMHYADREDPITRQEFEKRSAIGQRDAEDYRALMYHAGGKVEYVWFTWKATGNPEALRQLRMFIGEELKHAFDLGAHSGIFTENRDYFTELDQKITAAGGQRTVEALQK